MNRRGFITGGAALAAMAALPASGAGAQTVLRRIAPGFRTGMKFGSISSAIFTDNFDRPNEALEANPNWSLFFGSFTGAFLIVNGKVDTRGSGKSTPTYVTAPDTGVLDHFAESVVGVQSVNFSTTVNAPAIRLSADGSGVGVRQSSGSYDILRRSASGTVTQIGQLVQAPVIGDVVRIFAVGNDVTVIVNNGNSATVSLSNVANTGTRSGFYLRGASSLVTQFDNWRSGPGTGA